MKILQWIWFFAMQIVQIPFKIAGLILIPIAIFRDHIACGPTQKWHWADNWMWLWDNYEDGIVAPGKPYTGWNAFVWSALRNSVNNWRLVKWQSIPGGVYLLIPLGKKHYFHMGFRPTEGWPVFSGGSNS